MSSIAEIELNIKEAQEMVDLGKALERLMKNRDFTRVIKEGYLDHEAVRLVHMKADPQMQTPERQAAILRDIDGIGCLTGYFQKIRLFALQAANAIEAGEQAIEEIRAEEGGEA